MKGKHEKWGQDQQYHRNSFVFNGGSPSLGCVIWGVRCRCQNHRLIIRSLKALSTELIATRASATEVYALCNCCLSLFILAKSQSIESRRPTLLRLDGTFFQIARIGLRGMATSLKASSKIALKQRRTYGEFCKARHGSILRGIFPMIASCRPSSANNYPAILVNHHSKRTLRVIHHHSTLLRIVE